MDVETHRVVAALYEFMGIAGWTKSERRIHDEL